MFVEFLASYGRFLSSSIVMAKPIAITTIIVMIPGNRYVSAIDCSGASVGAGVAAAGSTANDVIVLDGQ